MGRLSPSRRKRRQRRRAFAAFQKPRNKYNSAEEEILGLKKEIAVNLSLFLFCVAAKEQQKNRKKKKRKKKTSLCLNP